MNKDEALTLALEALENLKEVVIAVQVLGIKAGATGKNMRLGESFLHNEAIIAIKESLAQPEQEIDWKDMYDKEKRRSAMWLAKYEAVAGPSPKAYPQAQPAQEPVTWMCKAFDGEACEQSNHDECENPIPLYTTPPKRPWVDLTEQEALDCFSPNPVTHRKNIAVKIKENNT